VVSAHSGLFHATLNYERTDAHGKVIQHETVSAGPENENLTTNEKIGATLEELSRNDRGASRFRTISAKHNPSATTADDLYETLTVGPDLSFKWNAIVQYANDFNEKGYAYRGAAQNSNTFAVQR
jgi:hypothetical protein